MTKLIGNFQRDDEGNLEEPCLTVFKILRGRKGLLKKKINYKGFFCFTLI